MSNLKNHSYYLRSNNTTVSTQEIKVEEIDGETDTDKSRALMRHYLMDLFSIWRADELNKTMDASSVPLLPTKNQSKIIKKELMALTDATSIYQYMKGKNSFNQAFLLSAIEADEIMTYYIKLYRHNVYEYTNKIGPFIFDVWNTYTQESTFLCYFKELGELKTIPHKTKQLFKLWDRYKDVRLC